MMRLGCGGKPGIERRVHPRCLMLSGIARCIVGGRSIHGYAMNLSRGGIFIATPDEIHPGEVVDVEFSLPSDRGHVFACKAEVVWKRPQVSEKNLPSGVGMKFLNLPEGDAEVIDKWVELEIAKGNISAD